MFKDEFETMNSIPVELCVKDDTLPHFHQPRPELFALKEAAERERDTLVGGTMLTTVSARASLIVPVPKEVGKVYMFMQLLQSYQQ